MKRMWTKAWLSGLGIILGLGVATASAAPAAQFSADMIQVEPNRIIEGRIYVRDDLYRMELQEDGKDVVVIVDGAASLTRVLIPSEKMFLEMQNTDPESLMNNPFQGFRHTASQYETKTAGRETVNGYKCTRLVVFGEGQDLLTAWIADSLGFPVKIINHLSEGRYVELRNIREGPVNDALFSPPAEYSLMDSVPVPLPEWAANVPGAPLLSAPFEKALQENDIVRVQLSPQHRIKVRGENLSGGNAAFTAVAFKGGRPVKDPSFSTFNLDGKGMYSNVTPGETADNADELVIRVREGRVLVRTELEKVSGGAAPAESASGAPPVIPREQQSASTAVMLILDASGSMWGKVEGRYKIEIAREVMAGLILDLPDRSLAGLVAYGHRRKGDCSDVEELVPLGPLARKALVDRINAINPKGKTPITLSVQQTAVKLKEREDETVIILVSDGKETCEGDPCELVRELKEAGIRFTLHVIGFDVTEEERLQLECMAEAGGGRYFSADTVQDFQLAAREVVRESHDSGVLEVSPTKSGKLFNGFVEVYTVKHRRNVVSGYADDNKPFSMRIPPGTYDIVVRDMSVPEKPSIELKGIEVQLGKTSSETVEFALEGVLAVLATKAGEPFAAFFRMHKAGESSYFHSGYTKPGQPLGQKVMPGRYDVFFRDHSVLNKPEDWVRDVVVEAGRTGKAVFDFPGSGTLALTVTQGGRPAAAFFRMHKAGESSYFHSGYTKPGQPLTHDVQAGRYDVFFRDHSVLNKTEVWVRDVVVEAGRTGEALFDFPQSGTLELAASHGASPVRALFTVIQVEGERMLVQGYTETGRTVTVNVMPGRYRLRFEYSMPDKVRKEMEQVVEPGRTTRVDAVF